MGQREILKMIENLSSKIDSLSGRAPETVASEANDISLKNMASSSRAIRINEMTQDERYYRINYFVDFLNSIQLLFPE